MKGKIVNNIYYKKEKEKDKLRMSGGSWTINIAWLDNQVDDIVYQTESAIYKITKQEAIDHGFVREFKGELKLVVPIRHWMTNI